MEKWHVIIDIEKCEDCNNCFLSCKDEHVDNDWPPIAVSQPRHGHRWINIMRKERGEYPLIDVAYRPTPCMHCDHAPCIEKAARGAVYQRDDGIVIIDPQKAKGQKELVKACPYGAIWWNEDSSLPQKCTLCAHLLDQGWEKTRCTQVCPTGAMVLVKADATEFEQRIKAEKLEVLHPEYGTRPRVYYRNLYRYNRCFIAGSVAVEKNGVLDCAQGARVALNRGKKQLDSAAADAFGDFKFDDLAPHSGAYQLNIEFEGYQDVTMTVELADNVSLPNIVLTE